MHFENSQRWWFETERVRVDIYLFELSIRYKLYATGVKCETENLLCKGKYL